MVTIETITLTLVNQPRLGSVRGYAKRDGRRSVLELSLNGKSVYTRVARRMRTTHAGSIDGSRRARELDAAGDAWL